MNQSRAVGYGTLGSSLLESNANVVRVRKLVMPEVMKYQLENLFRNLKCKTRNCVTKTLDKM